MNEETIKAVDKFKKCRDTARRFFNENYATRLAPFTHIIKETMKANNLEVLPALLLISTNNTYQDNAMG